MKIAYVASSEFGCPAPDHHIQAALWICQQVMEGMTKRGHETIYIGVDGSTAKASKILSMGPAFFDIYTYNDWIKLSTLEKDQTLFSYQVKLQMFLIDQMKTLGADLVHYHTSPPIFMLPFADKILEPKIVTIHDKLRAAYEPIIAHYAHKDIRFVTISNAQRQGMPHFRYSQTIYNGIPIEQYPFEETSGNQLIFLGRIKQIKGIKDCVVASKKSGIPLVIVGRTAKTEEEFIEREITPRVDKAHIRLLGVAGHEEKTRLLGQSKALLFPIHWEEPFGIVMIEAMACGTPVIAYNRGSVPEIIVDGKTGFIVNENDTQNGQWIIKKKGIEGLVEAIGRIGEIDRRACRRHVEEHFTAEKMVENYEMLYHRMITEK